MIEFKEFVLSNGLKVIAHPDHSSQAVCLNILYKVGSRNEHPERTGLAHLFEHLMFSGSGNIESFDEPLQAVGGDNNAFTNADITNYYTLVPKDNVETAFWLESDRMFNLNLNQNSLDVQKSVVVEEFKQRYLNQPYGDVWLKMRPEIYKKHPYQWPTIGKDPAQIDAVSMEDARSFYEKNYAPGNAILTVGGNIQPDKVYELAEKWFGNIQARDPEKIPYEMEPAQLEKRILEVEGNVPHNAFYKTFHMPARGHADYHACDLLSDILANGKSSVLHKEMVRNSKLLSSVSCYVTGNADPGLFVIEGRLMDGVAFDQVEERLATCIHSLGVEVSETELDRVKNMAEASVSFGNIELLNRCMGLTYAAFIGNTNLVNEEIELIQAVTTSEIETVAKKILTEHNSTTLYYRKNEA